MKRLIVLILVILIISGVIGLILYVDLAPTIYKDDPGNLDARFITVEEGVSCRIVADKVTGVCYYERWGYNTGYMSVLLNADGTPILYQDIDN